MRTLPALLVVAMVLIMTTLEADADAILKLEKDPKRKLLGETALGRKAIAGGGSDSIHIASNDFGNSKIVNSDNGVAKVSYNKNDENAYGDDNEVNDSYQNYENGPGTSTSNHHIFIQKPPRHG